MLSADFIDRFGGLIRLYGETGVKRLAEAHVAIVGVGGVGSWTVEALCRSGIGHLTLIDMDEVCVSNTNRQLHAHEGNYGKAKIAALKDRCLSINPKVVVHEEFLFWTEKTQDDILQRSAQKPFTFLFDAIDSVNHKVQLVRLCRQRGLALLCSGSGGGRREPSQVTIKDMTNVRDDALLKQVRKQLRQKHNFPRTGIKDGNRKGNKKVPAFYVPCVVCPGKIHEPSEVIELDQCELPQHEIKSGRMNCDQGYGAATFVTAMMGMLAASHIVNHIAENRPVAPPFKSPTQ